MALVLKDRVRETSTTTGTGTLTLAGPVAGFQSFSAIGTGSQTYYTIVSTSAWEVGIGTWTSPNLLSRDTILASTNGGSAVNFGAGIKDVFLTFPAEGFAVAPPIGGTTPNTITGTTITGSTIRSSGDIKSQNYGVNQPVYSLTNSGLTPGLILDETPQGYEKLTISASTSVDSSAKYDTTGISHTFNAKVNAPEFNGVVGNTTPNTIKGTTITSTTGAVMQGAGTGTLLGSPATAYIGSTDGTSWGLAVKNESTTFDAGFGFSVGDLGNVALQAADDAGNLVDLMTFTGATGDSPVFYNLKFPTTTGSANQVLKTDGSGNLSWVTPNAGTVTSVGGTGTVNGLTLTGTVTGSGNLTLGGTLSLVSPPAIGSTTPNTGAFTTLTTTGAVTTTAVSDPSAPSNGNLSVYAKSFGGYTTLAARNALNTSFGLQSALWSKSIQMWTNTSATAGSWLNSVGGANGTFTAVQPTVGGTLYQTIRRSTYANVITTTNQILGVSNNYLCFFRGSTAGQGGFFFHARLGFDVWTNGGRFFAGLAAGTNIVTADPSTRNDICGFAVDAADNGAISFLTRNTVSATKASTGYTITSNKGYDVYFYCSPNGASIGWMIIDINAGTSASGSATLTLPTATVANTSVVLASNAALTAATAISIGVAKIYTETDY